MWGKNRDRSRGSGGVRCAALLLAVTVGGCVAGRGDPQDTADEVVQHLALQNWSELAEIVHPQSGVLFSPYGFVDMQHAVVLDRNDLRSAATDSTQRIWGRFDGTGEPIRMTFSEYYERFIYDAAYAAIECGAPNERIGQGNTLNNIGEVFSDESVFIECHHPGSDRYAGMDWRSLRIVLEPAARRWLLVGVVHDEWTI
ncbi:MAG: hypothetical protein KJO98_01800 [Rhodothermia bacterium]|nr:hypothetical protein [Rhodothermia bacterium]